MAKKPSGPPANDYLSFQSFSWQKRTGHSREKRAFSALCGDNPPTIVDGYGKWNIIDRPLRQGVTVPLGYNPAKIKVELRFGIWDGRFHGTRSDGTTWGLGWDARRVAAENVEEMIDELHWMAGGNFETGPSPIVHVDPSPLMPHRYHGVGWVISEGIEWGANLRHRNGRRVYQEAAFSLLGYNGLGPRPSSPPTSQAGGYFTTTSHYRTALALAANPTGHAPESVIRGLARAILKDPRNNPCHKSRIHLSRRSITWQMPLKLVVWVPSHHI